MPKTELVLQNPLMNAAGTLGFFPDLKSPIEFSMLGGFVTNPISWEPRTPARGERFIQFPGGYLLHTGYPNPGFKAIIRLFSQRWARSPLPIIVHLLAHDANTLKRMVSQLEGIEGVYAIEIGLPPEIDPDSAYQMVMAALGELAVIVRLPFEFSPDLLNAIGSTEINAISLAPPRGTLPATDGSLVSGRLYGPGLYPQALERIKKLAQIKMPVIGGGGVYTLEDSRVFLEIGAVAVQLDSVLWLGSFLHNGNV